MTYLPIDISSLAQATMAFAIIIGGIMFRYERTINDIKRRLDAAESEAIRSRSESRIMSDWREKYDVEAAVVRKELRGIAVSLGKMSIIIEHIEQAIKKKKG